MSLKKVPLCYSRFLPMIPWLIRRYRHISPMEVLLLSDISGIGKKNDLIVVASGFALNHLLPSRKAIVVTPNVRKQYAEHIKRRALEREQERQLLISVSSAVGGKVVHISAKAAKTGKLYASVTEDMIKDALMSEYGIDVPVSAITLKEHIKTPGTHTATLTVGAQSSSSLTIDVKADIEKPVKA